MVHDLIDSARTTCRDTKLELFSTSLYSYLQIIDLEYFNVNAVLVGNDEKPIYDLAKKRLKRFYRANSDLCLLSRPNMMSAIGSEQMHSSEKKGLIALNYTADEILEYSSILSRVELPENWWTWVHTIFDEIDNGIWGSKIDRLVVNNNVFHNRIELFEAEKTSIITKNQIVIGCLNAFIEILSIVKRKIPNHPSKQ